MNMTNFMMIGYPKITILGNPPSDNNIYHSFFNPKFKRMVKYKTKKMLAYEKICEACIPKDMKPCDKSFVVDIVVYFGDKRRRDIQGHCKAIFDSLTGKVYHDDSQVKQFTARKEYDKQMPRAEITIKEL